MKSFLIFLMLTFSVSMHAFCQSTTYTDQADVQPTVEELKMEMLQLKQDTQEIQLHLHKSHREFRTGTIFYAAGLGLTLLAAGSKETNNGLVLLGTGFLLAGGVLHIDSHKHIGRAGLKRLQFRQRK